MRSHSIFCWYAGEESKPKTTFGFSPTQELHPPSRICVCFAIFCRCFPQLLHLHSTTPPIVFWEGHPNWSCSFTKRVYLLVSPNPFPIILLLPWPGRTWPAAFAPPPASSIVPSAALPHPIRCGHRGLSCGKVNCSAARRFHFAGADSSPGKVMPVQAPPTL